MDYAIQARRVWILIRFSGFMFAQNPYGGILGRIADPSGASVAQATVRVTNLDTSVVTEGQTNSDGNYEFRQVIPGRYRVEVQAKGFKSFIREPVEVRVAVVVTLDVGLELGSSSQSITVTSEAPLLESSTATVGTVLDNRRITDLPRFGDSVISELQLSPGVAQTYPPTYYWTPNDLGSTSQFTVAGATTGYTLITLDGNPIQVGTGATVTPQPEMVQEVSTQVNTVDTSVGRFTGLVADMITKGGTNKLHGDVVETYMGQTLIAKDYFTKQVIDNPATGPITPQKIAQAWPEQGIRRFRFDVGGPVYISGLYDGRDHTFWSFGMDFMTFLVNERNVSSVPTAAEREGDFSSLLALGPAYQLYDPATTTPAGNGLFERSPFPGNIIPPSRLDPVAMKLLNYWELPNTPGTVDGRNNFVRNSPNNEPVWQGVFRMDRAFSHRNNFFASGTFEHGEADGFDPFYDSPTAKLAIWWRLHRRQGTIGLGDVETVDPNLVLNFHWNITRYSQDTPSASKGFNLASLGWPASLVSQINPTEATLPGICMPNYPLVGGFFNPGGCMGGGGDWFNGFNRQAASVDVGYTKGNHRIRFGFAAWIMQSDTRNNRGISPNYSVQCENPTFNFDSTYTGGPYSSSPGPTNGGDLAAFLLGIPTTGKIAVCADSTASNKYLAGFAQDNWKVGRKLTFNFGIRYEVDTGTTEKYNRTVRGFDFTDPNPISSEASANYAMNPVSQLPASSFQTLGGLLFAGVNGVPRNLWNTQTHNFSPRVGLGYLLRPTTVLRASYGIFFQPLGVDFASGALGGIIQSGFQGITTFVPTLNNGQTFIANLDNRFPNGFAQPVGAAGGLETLLGDPITYVLPQLREPYTQRWDFSIQRMLPSQILLDVSYMGSRSVGLEVTEAQNSTFRQYLSTSPTRDQATISELSQQVASPFYGIPQFQETGLASKTIALSQLLTPHPQFTGISTIDNAGSASYNSLQARVDRRFSHGWTLQVAYTYSRFMQANTRLNPTDPTPYNEVSPYDFPQALTVNGTYELPFGKNKRWLSSGRWRDKIFGGWSTDMIYTAQSGRLIPWGNIIFTGNLKDISLPDSQRTPARWFNTAAGFDTNSQTQLADNIRTFRGYLSSVRTAGVNCLSLTWSKTLKVRERVRIKFYAMMNDVNNFIPFDVPNSTPTSSAFGQITDLYQNAVGRDTTFGVKMSW
jgi:hypothetical protein